MCYGDEVRFFRKVRSMRPASLMALAALVTALAAAPQSASAQSIAYSVPGTTNVRAGPSTQYPVVARVRGGVEILVFGCLSDRAWCDVQVYDTRGWMSSRRLEFVYAGSRVLVPEYYAYFSAPIVRFDFGYWDRYYEDRPFYRRWRRGHRSPQLDDLGPGTNYPGIEGPGSGGGVYQDPGGGGYVPPNAGGGYAPGMGGDAPPVAGGYEPPAAGGGYDGGSIGGGPGEQMPSGTCPPDIVCQ